MLNFFNQRKILSIKKQLDTLSKYGIKFKNTNEREIELELELEKKLYLKEPFLVSLLN